MSNYSCTFFSTLNNRNSIPRPLTSSFFRLSLKSTLSLITPIARSNFLLKGYSNYFWDWLFFLKCRYFYALEESTYCDSKILSFEYCYRENVTGFIVNVLNYQKMKVMTSSSLIRVNFDWYVINITCSRSTFSSDNRLPFWPLLNSL